MIFNDRVVTIKQQRLFCLKSGISAIISARDKKGSYGPLPGNNG